MPTQSKKTMPQQITTTLLAIAATLWLGNALAQGHPLQFAADVDAFHSVLAPVWHARPGKERSRNACAKTGQMEALAKDIRTANASALQASVAALKAKCAAAPADIDAALFDVHEAFHRLTDAPPAS
jgi:hypothetical protein